MLSNYPLVALQESNDYVAAKAAGVKHLVKASARHINSDFFSGAALARLMYHTNTQLLESPPRWKGDGADLEYCVQFFTSSLGGQVCMHSLRMVTNTPSVKTDFGQTARTDIPRDCAGADFRQDRNLFPSCSQILDKD